ncbi:hypothetical protein L207DRAFT_592230 [Hyaloscypha variabilis F]|uniref:CFEM domain-containing protein n=1 Tax=Hyaloscypha variabilis (strain UAMH 11265 / GT02V1 / F) TaxID=1149755 RepID=A0A2J6QX78_HYAVF|nr:hypothetical protein L207DRAFT_592230 [Hyaloscypha variabilis F]
MRSTLSTVVALASSLQLASATYSWNNAPAFSCPANTNNHCNSQQSSGFDWSGLSFGSFSTYGSFDFSGFTCASSFGGGSKRDLLSGRGFQSTCITGTTHSDASSCPSFGCGSSSEVSAFSVSEIEISVEFDCSLEFHYSMPGGTTCKQTSSCSAGGSVVKNSQCGGATSVTVVYPSQTSGSGTTKTSCSIGVHSIGFDCSSASSTQYHSTATSSPTKPTTSPVQTTSSTTPVQTSSSSPVQVSSSSSPAATTFSTYIAQTTSTSAQVTVSSPAGTTSSTLIAGTTSSTLIGGTTSSTLIAGTTSSSAQGVVSSPTSASVVEVVTTVVVDTTTTLCPVTLTHTNSNGISLQVSTSTSTLFLTTTKTVCTRCEAQSTSSPVATSAPAGVQSSSAVYVPTTVITSSGPITTATCPDVLPQCLNTWLFIEGCSSNADTACFCPSSDFVSNVFSCLSAYGASDTEISSAQTYFQGICAPYIPSNPALVTCASSVTATVTQSYPVTTITVSQIITVPCTQSTGVSAGYTIASSFTTTVLSTQVTVPQVVFTTVGTTSGGAVLITGAPTIGNAGVAAPTVVPTYSTLAVTTTSNGTTKATSTPTQVFSGSAGKNSIAIGASLFAVLFAILIL